MTKVTICRHRRGDWRIGQAGAWAVFAPTFSQALHEAAHYAMQYECHSELDKALDRFMEGKEAP